MNLPLLRTPAIALLALIVALPASAEPSEALMAGYATAAKAADPAFSGFSATRGEAFHLASPASGKAETPSCTSCHGSDPTAPGKTRSGKRIDPMAVSATPDRYSDPAKVEKWFGRNCRQVLGRECAPQEKGDWLTAMRQR